MPYMTNPKQTVAKARGVNITSSTTPKPQSIAKIPAENKIDTKPFLDAFRLFNSTRSSVIMLDSLLFLCLKNS